MGSGFCITSQTSSKSFSKCSKKKAREDDPLLKKVNAALAGNRTRASRVAGENSTTEPPVLGHTIRHKISNFITKDNPVEF